MKRLTLLFFIIPALVNGQQRPITIFDTVLIDEVVVSRTIHLNDEAMADKYQSSGFSSIDKINSRLSGVSVISRGAYAMEPVLQSFTSGQINVTIDEMKMFGACTDKMDPITSYVEPVNLKSLVISHGSNGSAYGSTIGGSYDMKLESAEVGIKDKWGAYAGAGFESVSKGIMNQAKIQFSGTRLAWRMSGVFKDYQDYTDGKGSRVPFTQFKKVNLHNSLVYELSPDRNLKFDYLIDDAFHVGYHALPMDVARAKARIYALEYIALRSFGGLKNFRIKLYVNTVYHLMDDSMRDSLYFVENSRIGGIDSVYMKMDMPGWSGTYGLYTKGSIYLSDKHMLSFKLESYYNKSKAEMTMHMENLANPGEPPMFAETWPENYRQVTGLFLKESYFLRPQINFEFNIRIDYSTSEVISRNGWQQFAVLGKDVDKPYHKISKSFNFNTTVRTRTKIGFQTGFGYGERLPALSEQFGFYLFNAYDGYDYIGNPDLKQEKSINSWLIVKYEKKDLKFQWQNYGYHIRDYILGIYNPGQSTLSMYASGVKQYSNVAVASIFSTGFQGQWYPVEVLEFYVMSKYTCGQIRNNEPLPLIPPLKNVFSVSYQKVKYYVQAEAELSSAQVRINNNYGELPSKAFSVFNLRSGYNFDFTRLNARMSIGIDNLFNKIYSEHLDWGNYYRPGRNYYFQVLVGI